MSADNIHEATIAALTAATPRRELEISEITTDTPIGAGGLGVDSLALLNALVALETRFGIVFDDRSVASTPFETVGALEHFLERALARAEFPNANST